MDKYEEELESIENDAWLPVKNQKKSKGQAIIA